MLTLDSEIQIPSYVISTTVDQDAVLLNTKTNKYYALDEVGARFWALITKKKTLQEVYRQLLDEYAVSPDELEKDLLELINDFVENKLVKIAEK